MKHLTKKFVWMENVDDLFIRAKDGTEHYSTYMPGFDTEEKAESYLVKHQDQFRGGTYCLVSEYFVNHNFD